MAHPMRPDQSPSTALSLGKTKLTDEQMMVLRRYTSSFEDMFAQLEYMRELGMFEHTDWQLCLVVLRFVGGIEEGGFEGLKGSQGEIEAYTAVLCNVEYVLYMLNRDWTGDRLRYNSVLRHWVDVVVRLQSVVVAALQGNVSPDLGHVPDWWFRAQAARLRVILWAVSDPQTGLMKEGDTPDSMVQSARSLLTRKVDVEPLIKMLQEESIPVPSFVEESLPSPTLPRGKDIPPPAAITEHKVPEEGVFFQWMHDSPNDALQWLIHLPPSLNSFDFLTKVLSRKDAFDLYDLSPGDVAREQLQHSLRHIERLGSPDHSTDENDAQSSNDTSVTSGNSEEVSQAVKVLVVYLRNLIARGILPLDTVYLDVQEICVRYIFLVEVREFRTWLENAVGGGPVPGGVGG